MCDECRAFMERDDTAMIRLSESTMAMRAVVGTPDVLVAVQRLESIQEECRDALPNLDGHRMEHHCIRLE